MSREEEKALRKAARDGDVWCRIIVADLDSKGLRLSADDVGTLAADNAIETCAMAFATGQDGTR